MNELQPLRRAPRSCCPTGVFALAACTGGGGGSHDASASAGSDGPDTQKTDVDTNAEGVATGADGSSRGTDSDPGSKFDVGGADGITDAGDEGPVDLCHVVDEMDAVGDCRARAPADSFDPAIQWTWSGPDGQRSIVPALVANLTDDNADGEIDLCDVPDVVVLAGSSSSWFGHLFVLDGATGAEHFSIEQDLDPEVTPALGDIDGDGLVEIIAARYVSGTGRYSSLVAFEHDGALKWESKTLIDHGQGFAIALADIDADGDVEIVGDDTLHDENGVALWTAPTQEDWLYADWHCTATVIADLDGDGLQEVVLGKTAYRVDGTQYYAAPSLEPGFPQVADLDEDPEPEIVVTTRAGVSVLEHDGSVKLLDSTPTGDGYSAWFRPATVHDFDGDNVSDLALSSASHYSAVKRDMSLIWTADVVDNSGWSAGTAFDFLGDGVAEAMYTDEETFYVFDGFGAPLLTIPRESPTLIEYPTVVDVDNDGSAEILVVSYGDSAPALQVIRDADDRWIQPRRIWNQHTYHVTNVREDGTIPQHEAPSWLLLNTYRTNAQIQSGSLCKPEPAG